MFIVSLFPILVIIIEPVLQLSAVGIRMAGKIGMYSNYICVSRYMCVWVCIEEILMASEVKDGGKRRKRPYIKFYATSGKSACGDSKNRQF